MIMKCISDKCSMKTNRKKTKKNIYKIFKKYIDSFSKYTFLNSLMYYSAVCLTNMLYIYHLLLLNSTGVKMKFYCTVIRAGIICC